MNAELYDTVPIIALILQTMTWRCLTEVAIEIEQNLLYYSASNILVDKGVKPKILKNRFYKNDEDDMR